MVKNESEKIIEKQKEEEKRKIMEVRHSDEDANAMSNSCMNLLIPSQFTRARTHAHAHANTSTG